MQISVSLAFIGALMALSAFMLSKDFRSTAKEYAHYDWWVLAWSVLIVFIAFWSLPLVVIKDTFSPALGIIIDLHADSLRPASYKPASSYFDYFRSLLAGFALFSFIASVIFAWIAHCLILMLRRRGRPA